MITPYSPLGRSLACALAAVLTPIATSGDDSVTEPVAIATTPGFDGETIRLGLLLPLTGPLQSVGEPMEAGYRAYVERLNEAGGVAGSYPIELVVADSQYEPAIAVQKYNQLRDDVVMFGGLMGTPVVSALLEHLVRDEVVAAPLSFDAEWIREPNLLPVGTPLQARAALAVEWALTDGGAEDATLCAFTASDPFGEASLEGVQAVAEAIGTEVAESVTYRRGDTDFNSQVGSLAAAGCELIFLGVTQNITGPVLGLAAEQGIDALWIGQTGSWTASLAESPAAGYLADHFFYVQEGPQWGDTSVPSMAEFVTAWNDTTGGAPADYYGILSWCFASAVHQVLEEAVASGDLSRRGVLTAMEGVEVLQFGGLTGDYPYGPAAERQPPRSGSIFRVDPTGPWGLQIVARDVESAVAADLEL